MYFYKGNMMRTTKNVVRLLSVWITLVTPFIYNGIAYAAASDEAKTLNAIQNFTKLATLFVGSVAVFFFVLGGYRYITSTDDPEKLSGAKRTLINACIGVVVAIMANVAVAMIKDTATSSFGN